jgi:hypothetical protein
VFDKCVVQDAKVVKAILVIQKDGGSVDPTLGDVEGNGRQDEAGCARHAMSPRNCLSLRRSED